MLTINILKSLDLVESYRLRFCGERIDGR
jgi:hypothetical protein